MNFEAVTGAVEADVIVAALGAIAAIKILPNVARWGFGKVVNWF